MKNINTFLRDNRVLEQISKIHLLRIISLIVNNLAKDDIPEFEAILSKKDSGALLPFAIKKIPQFEVKLLEEIKATNQKLQEVAQKYAT